MVYSLFLRTRAAQNVAPEQEVLCSNPLEGNLVCSPSPSEETINRDPYTPSPTTHALICEESKDPGIPKECQLQFTKQITSMLDNQTHGKKTSLG